MPLNFEQGEAFQFDWSEKGLVVGGIYRRMQVSHMKLCASRAFWLVVYPSQGHEMLFDAHARSFAALGGVPRRDIYDNMKTAVDKVNKGKGRIVNARFSVMCAHYLLDADFCAWADLLEQDESACTASKWLLEHLLQAEHTDRAMRSVSHQMFAAKSLLHRDLAGFDFASSTVDQPLVRQLATLEFTDTAQNFVLIGGPGTGKTHLATAMAVSGIATKGKRARFYSTADLVNVLEREKRHGKAGRLALSCCGSTWSCWTSWDIYPSPRPAAPCCSTCCRSYTNTAASSSRPT